jgi:hypothetical protein
MTTIFHFIAFFGVVIGFAVGGIIGGKLYGMFGGLGGAVLGAYIGLVAGRLPGFFSKRALVKKIRHKTTDQLRAILHGNEFYLFHLVIAELAVRGEDIQKERGCVVQLLVSDNYAARVCGWQTLRCFFPEVAKRIAEYQPKDSIEVCRTKTQGLAEMA